MIADIVKVTVLADEIPPVIKVDTSYYKTKE